MPKYNPTPPPHGVGEGRKPLKAGKKSKSFSVKFPVDDLALVKKLGGSSYIRKLFYEKNPQVD